MNEYVLTPWSNLTEEDQKYIIANQATQPGHGYIDPKDYEKSNFYTLNGRLAKGTDVDNWLKQQNTSTQVNKSLVQSFIDRMGWGQDNPIWGNRRISNFQKTYDKNPNFTLDNNKIKSIVPNENYHVDIQLVMADILENLKNSHNIDNEYNYITDNLLIEQSREQNNDHVNRQLESYLTSLDDQYLKELLWFKRRRQLSRLLEPLRMVKRFLKKIIKVVAQIK